MFNLIVELMINYFHINLVILILILRQSAKIYLIKIFIS